MFFDIFFQLCCRQGHPLTVLHFFSCVSYLTRMDPHFSGLQNLPNLPKVCVCPFQVQMSCCLSVPPCEAVAPTLGATSKHWCSLKMQHSGFYEGSSCWPALLSVTLYSIRSLCGIAQIRLPSLRDDGRTRAEMVPVWHTAVNSRPTR